MDIKKGQWTGLEYQVPAPKLEIFTKGSPGKADITYSADPKAGAWAKLLSYNFSESVDDLEGSFSFSVENGQVGGKNVFDLIPIRSIVKIYEGDMEHPAFIGIIRRRHLGKTMTSQGVKRTMAFSGKSIISCIVEYTVSLDVKIQDVADPTARTLELITQLARDGLTIKDFMKETWEHFKEVSEINGMSMTGLAELINKFIGGPDEFIEVTGQENTFRYNISSPFYNAANNVIAQVWRNLLPEKVYEMFSRCDNGEPKIIARQVPFGGPGNNDWADLDAYEISPISLTDYELDQSDEEVYTAFASNIIGSGKSHQFYLAANQKEKDSIVEHDKDKQKIYGFKPLEIEFIGYDRQGNIKEEWERRNPDLTETLKELNELAAYWYSRLEEMYSGTISIITDFKKPWTNPRAGCRAKFIGGEFYIEKADHAWHFERKPTIKLTVSRGMVYDTGGKMRSGTEGVIRNVGGHYRELERENA